jgi:hypothetical protein
MSVLKKIGLFLAGASADITKILGMPFISQLLGAIPGKFGVAVQTGVADLNTFAGFVSIGEAMFPAVEGQKTGSVKLTAITPLFQKSILLWAQSSLPGHNKLIVTPEVFAEKCGKITSDWADIMNCFGE